jgi:hypothetical protein
MEETENNISKEWRISESSHCSFAGALPPLLQHFIFGPLEAFA